ncbi:MAG: EscU/YscU/HrcU family type III secretion system export apparatus switch protein [Planctomycetota bacterium]|nr:EscU/YscU/HrcU family type III secretion system export apparatus switch protein [Planctomycetota bacterium]
MSELSDRDTRTIPATPLKRQRAWQQGNCPQSRSLVAAVVLLSAALLLANNSTLTLDSIKSHWAELLQFRPELIGHVGPKDPAALTELVSVTGFRILGQLAPLAIGLMSVAILASVLQTGFIWVPSKIKLDTTRMSPQHWWRQITRGSRWVEHFGSACRSAIILAVAIVTLWTQRAELAHLSFSNATGVEQGGLQVLSSVVLRVAMVLLAIASVDFFWQRWKWNQSLRMTPAELKEEQHAQQRQRGYAENRLQRQGFPADDPAAIATLSNREWGEIDFIIYSPDDAAVALQYNPAKMDLPRVIKVIRDGNSTDMIQQARPHNITVYLDNHLAAQLVQLTINKQSIPVELYEPVAKLLQTPNLT